MKYVPIIGIFTVSFEELLEDNYLPLVIQLLTLITLILI